MGTATWISEYDHPSRKVTLLLADPDLLGTDWTGIRKDDALSDPEGNFEVFVAYDATDNLKLDAKPAPIVKVVARLDEEGALAHPHPQFDIASVGSMTIWPYKDAGERFGLSHWMWWSGPPFHSYPQDWAEANQAVDER